MKLLEKKYLGIKNCQMHLKKYDFKGPKMAFQIIIF
jgi:hypothetical protein